VKQRALYHCQTSWSRLMMSTRKERQLMTLRLRQMTQNLEQDYKGGTNVVPMEQPWRGGIEQEQVLKELPVMLNGSRTLSLALQHPLV
jgi:hypothetical protein